MKNLAAAIIAVMKAVKGVEKNTTVGSGNFAYKGVNDKDVKEAYRGAMIEHGLCILPLEVNENLRIDSWKDKYDKNKMSVFCSVNTKYLLLHTSGESQIIAGLGHGQDPMDKAAGKATTYAMKYALLYTFMTPVGAIDDTDKQHSQEKDAPPKEIVKKVIKDAAHAQKLIDHAVKEGKTHQDIALHFVCSEEQLKKLKLGIAKKTLENATTKD
jgi:hypothetical protein